MNEELTDSALVKAWSELLPVSNKDLHESYADGQVQLGHGRVQPDTLTEEQVREIRNYAYYTLGQ